MDQTTMILLAIALTVALAVGGVAFAFLGSGDDAKANKRVAAVSRGTIGRGSAAAKADTSGESNAKRRKQVQETLKEIERKQEQVKAKPTLGAMLEQAD